MKIPRNLKSPCGSELKYKQCCGLGTINYIRWEWTIMKNSTWLTFWSSWLGAIIGEIITIVGIYFTLRLSKK